MWVEKHITRQESPKGYYYPLLKAEKSTKLTRGIIQTSWSGLKLGMLKWYWYPIFPYQFITQGTISVVKGLETVPT